MQKVSIRIKGQINRDWAEWFEGFEIVYRETNESTLTGVVADQAAFYGLIGKLRDLGLQVLSFNSMEIPDSDLTQDG